MKKVAILTRRAGYNMGSSLQAYAMQRLVEKTRNEATIINYYEYAHDWRWRVKPMFRRISGWLSIIFYPVVKVLNESFCSSQRNGHIQRKKFDSFEKQYLNLTPGKYENSRQIASIKDNYDAFVCGSDQIWSPGLFDRTFYLDFITKGDGPKKISYAPSIACDRADQLLNEQLMLIKDFDNISCREKIGAEILSKSLGVQVPDVLDPTLMIGKEEWINMLPENFKYPKGKYILCYFLHSKDNTDDSPDEIVSKIAKKMGCEVINVRMHNLPECLTVGKKVETLSPVEFLALLSNAEMVLSNSFHATVFSIIFNRKFYAFSRKFRDGNKGNQNSRIKSLLELVGLQDRNVDYSVSVDKISMDEYPYPDLVKLDNARANSLHYLMDSLA